MKTWVSLLMLMILIVGSPVSGDTDTSDTAVILPFTHDKAESSSAIADQASWLLGKKLRFWKKIDVLDRNDVFGEARADDPVPEMGQNSDISTVVSELDMLTPVRWIVTGDLIFAGVDENTKIEGPVILGMAQIPIRGEFQIRVYDTVLKKQIWSGLGTATSTIPRLRWLGMYRNPLPHTPRAIDAFIHQTILELSEKILAVLESLNR